MTGQSDGGYFEGYMSVMKGTSGRTVQMFVFFFLLQLFPLEKRSEGLTVVHVRGDHRAVLCPFDVLLPRHSSWLVI